VAIARTATGLRVVRVTTKDAAKGTPETENAAVNLKAKSVFLRISVAEAICAFSYSTDGKKFHPAGNDIFVAQPGVWIGAKVGLFAIGSTNGHADYNWFRFVPLRQSARTPVRVQ
jgi:hypothetical protein